MTGNPNQHQPWPSEVDGLPMTPEPQFGDTVGSPRIWRRPVGALVSGMNVLSFLQITSIFRLGVNPLKSSGEVLLNSLLVHPQRANQSQNVGFIMSGLVSGDLSALVLVWIQISLFINLGTSWAPQLLLNHGPVYCHTLVSGTSLSGVAAKYNKKWSMISIKMVVFSKFNAFNFNNKHSGPPMDITKRK